MDNTHMQVRSTCKRVLLMLWRVEVIWGQFKRQTEVATSRNKVEGRMYEDDFPKCRDLIFFKIKSKNSENGAKGADLRM